jgi:hypothetical protein
MTEQTQQPVDESSELETLKARADLLGIKYHHNIGVQRLGQLVNSAISKSDENRDVKDLISGDSEYLTGSEYQKLVEADRLKDANKLIRIRVTCMNPIKKDLSGEIISVGSSKLGTFKKWIQYNTPDGWHVPKIIYDFMVTRECSVFYSVKDRVGNDVRKSKRVKEYAIEVLPPLTKQELKDLAQRQSMARGTNSSTGE